MGMPSAASLRKFLTDEDIFGDDEGMLRFHTKNNPPQPPRRPDYKTGKRTDD